MLPFTQEKLTILGKTIFYYNRSCFIPEINIFSNTIFDDLKNNLGIEFKISQRIKFSQAVNDDGTSSFYNDQKIERISLLYEFYVDSILRMTQFLYYEDLSNIKLYTFCPAVSNSIQQIFVPNAGNPTYIVREPEQFQAIINAISNELGDNNQKMTKKLFQYILMKLQIKPEEDCKIATNWSQKKCQPFKIMIEQQINLQFPIKTLQDKVVEKEKTVVSKKKTK